jgi:phosphoribosylanthranilate isomerase
MIHVKICGIHRLDDASAALQYGADELGFLVGQKHHSPDFLDESDAAAIVGVAGGPSPDNVKDAIRQVHPYGVDVNSGTKGADGYKDHARLQRFIESAKR